MGDSNPQRDWGFEVWTRKPSKSVRTPRSGHSFVGLAFAVMSVPVLAVLLLAAYFGYHAV